ncbi:hypothetical protein PO124_16655 [Bacillus licheniformis]|nr:hypothetical protein [Bacillus licheniformis]
MKELKEKKGQQIIALTHLGYNRDLELAKKVKGIDLIIGGHTHTLVDHLKVVENEEPTIVAQVKDYGQFWEGSMWCLMRTASFKRTNQGSI